MWGFFNNCIGCIGSPSLDHRKFSDCCYLMGCHRKMFRVLQKPHMLCCTYILWTIWPGSVKTQQIYIGTLLIQLNRGTSCKNKPWVFSLERNSQFHTSLKWLSTLPCHQPVKCSFELQATVMLPGNKCAMVIYTVYLYILHRELAKSVGKHLAA